MNWVLLFIILMLLAMHLENKREFRDIKNKLNDIYRKD